MANRDTPYGAFNFTVSFDGGETFGGFSDVSGIGTELTVAEYRNGNEKENHVRKVPGVHKVSDVTLKRGIVDSKSAVRLDQGDAHHRRRRQEKERDDHLARRGADQGPELDPRQRHPDEIHRADAGGEGRRRRGDGRARARSRGHGDREVGPHAARVRHRTRERPRGAAAHRHHVLRRLRPDAQCSPAPAGDRGSARRRLDRRAVAAQRGASPHARAAAGRRRELGRLRSDLRLAFQARGGRQRGDLRLLSRRGGAAVLRAGRTTGDRRARGRPLAVHGRGRDESREPHGTHRTAGAAVRGSVAAVRSHRSAHVAGDPAPVWAAGSQPRVHARSRRRVRRRSRAARRDAAARADQRRLRRVQPLGSGSVRRSRPSSTSTRRARMRMDSRTGPARSRPRAPSSPATGATSC